MTTIDLLLWLLQLMGAAVIACWIAYQSTIIQKIKSMLYLCEDQVLPKWRMWFKPIGFIFETLRDLLNCPYCQAFHYGWMTSYFIYDMHFMPSLLCGGLTIIMVEAYRKFSL